MSYHKNYFWLSLLVCWTDSALLLFEDFGDSGTSIIGRMLSERHMRMRDSASNSLSY